MSDTKKDAGESITGRDTFRVRNLLRDKAAPLTFNQIRRITGLSDAAIKNQLKRLRRSGAIRRVSYGLWEYSPQHIGSRIVESIATPPHVTTPTYPPRYVLHDLVFSSKVTLSAGDFEKLGTSIKVLYPGFVTKTFKHSSAHFFLLDGYKVSVHNSGALTLYLRGQFWGQDFDDCMRPALQYARDVLRRFYAAICAQMHPVNWTARHHYARTEDLAARGFRHRKQKARVKLERGYFVFDYSDHLDHAEAQGDGGAFIDNVWRPFIEDLPRHPGISFGALLLLHKQLALLHGDAIIRIKRLEEQAGRGLDA